MYRRFDGIYASTIVPMHEDESIDFEALAAHIESVGRAPGIRGLLINGHAGENFTLASDEKRRIVACARRVLGPGRLLISGVYSESAAQAGEDAAAMESAGADALLVFPPFSWALAEMKDVILAHHRRVIAGTGLPVMLYQAAIGAGCLSYSPDTLRALLALERVAGIKEGSWETARYEANYRLVRRHAPSVRIMPSGDEHLLSTFMLGGDGSQVSIAAIVPEAVVALWDAVRGGDLTRALREHERLYPLVRAVYGTAPAARATARLKACLHLLGRIPSPTMRAPMTASGPDERALLRHALHDAGLL